MKWMRKDHCNYTIADPTVSTTWTRKVGNLKIELTEFFGDITSRLWFKGQQILFTSPVIHKRLNRLATKKFLQMENAYQDAEFERIERITPQEWAIEKFNNSTL